jgi:hypothetical protein
MTGAGTFWLVGFVSVADWIGSNEDFFPFAGQWGRPPDAAIAAFAAGAEGWAADALRALGWLPRPRPAAPRPFAALFPFAPNPLQEAVAAGAEVFSGSALVVVEAPMGDGKTEAVWYVGDRVGASLGLVGEDRSGPRAVGGEQPPVRRVGYRRVVHLRSRVRIGRRAERGRRGGVGEGPDGQRPLAVLGLLVLLRASRGVDRHGGEGP